MKAEQVAEWLENAARDGRPYHAPAEAADAIRALIAERDRLREALRTVTGAFARKEGLSTDATKKLMNGQWHPGVTWKVHRALEIGRAALEPKP
jgi:hypothetical protein